MTRRTAGIAIAAVVGWGWSLRRPATFVADDGSG